MMPVSTLSARIGAFVKVTVCQLHDEPAQFAADWQGLAEHVRSNGSDLVLLPEMPFAPWFAARRQFKADVWRAAEQQHARWLERLDELQPARVAATRPASLPHGRRNQAFLYHSDTGLLPVHEKYYLPDETDFWEASWYDRGDLVFDPVGIAGLRLGFLICTELWFLEHARRYGRLGAHLVLTPRATEYRTRAKWLVGGRAAAVVSGAYHLSSNRCGTTAEGLRFGGWGWVVDPDGEVLALTDDDQPFATVEISLQAAEQARQTYPRYVAE
jgi:N-carbamoylputrescine amidase